MGAQLDDPNREAVGLEPIWSGTTEEAPPPEGEAQREPKAPKAPKHAAAPAPGPNEDDATGAT
jgi:hypothetical protein